MINNIILKNVKNIVMKKLNEKVNCEFCGKKLNKFSLKKHKKLLNFN